MKNAVAKHAVAHNAAKIVIAVALTLAVTVGSGMVGEQVGLDVIPSVYAGDCTGSSSGGGC